MSRLQRLFPLFFALIGCFLVCSFASERSSGGSWFTCLYNPTDGSYNVVSGKNLEEGVAWGFYSDDRNSSGWARFLLESNVVFGDDQQTYGSGYLEGFVTGETIWQNWFNTISNEFAGKVPEHLLKPWFSNNTAWMKAQIAENKGDDYWRQVELVLSQLQGMLDGYNAYVEERKAPSRKFELWQLMMLNSDGDLETIQQVLGGRGAEDASSSASVELLINRGTHCSSFVSITDDLSELYSGHTTWSMYYDMLRSYKRYDMPLHAQGTSARTTLFSSYPGFLSSVDDFYQLSTGLVVIETTNGCMNKTLLQTVVPQSVLSWIRVIVANRMATSGPMWVDVFSRENSGTYNNQWILVDYSLFTPGEPLPNNLLTVAEQIPGYVESADVTHYLRLGYWPSYNIPFFERIYNESGFVQMAHKYGDWFTYQMSPRAQIFRRQANSVRNMEDYKKLIRYNDWKNDPLAYGNPGNQISSRFDLVPINDHPDNPYLKRAAFGGIDSKATSWAYVQKGMTAAQSGPTHDDVPPFDWDDWAKEDIAHQGMPGRFDFDWVDMPGSE